MLEDDRHHTMSTPLTDRMIQPESQALDEDRGGCPCLLAEPCSPNCTCASPVMSGGCRRCATYGSLQQRQAAAQRLAGLDATPSASGASSTVLMDALTTIKIQASGFFGSKNRDLKAAGRVLLEIEITATRALLDSLEGHDQLAPTKSIHEGKNTSGSADWPYVEDWRFLAERLQHQLEARGAIALVDHVEGAVHRVLVEARPALVSPLKDGAWPYAAPLSLLAGVIHKDLNFCGVDVTNRQVHEAVHHVFIARPSRLRTESATEATVPSPPSLTVMLGSGPSNVLDPRLATMAVGSAGSPFTLEENIAQAASGHRIGTELPQSEFSGSPNALLQLGSVGRVHELKTDPDVFDAVASRNKTHEIRFNDRDFRVGDVLLLRRTESSGQAMRAGAPLVYSDRSPLTRTVSHILSGYGLAEGWCILSFAPTHRGLA